MQKGNALIFLLVGILILTGVAGGSYYFGRLTVPKGSASPIITSKTLHPSASRATEQSPQPTVVASPTPDPTTNWDTFKSEFGYSFKYPKTFWIVSSETRRMQNGSLNYQHGDSGPVPQGTVGYFEIVQSMSDSATTLANQKIDGYTKVRIVNDKTILVGGYNTRYVELESSENNKILYILVFIQKDNSYAIYLSVNNSPRSTGSVITSEELKATFNQVLPTLKFL